MATTDIITELNQLKSSLADKIPGTVYTVPEGYFDSFAGMVIKRIKALHAESAAEELSFLSPLLSAASRELPYSVPAGYFDGLDERAITGIRGHEDYQTTDEEMEALSPLLNSVRKKSTYSVPEGYFDELVLKGGLDQEKEAKVVSLGSNKKWFRYAAAAIITGSIVLGGLLFFNTRKPVDISNTHAWVEKNMKKVSTSDITSFVQLTGDQNKGITASVTSTDIKDMLKDVSDNDLQNFLTETDATEEYNDDLFLN